MIPISWTWPMPTSGSARFKMSSKMSSNTKAYLSDTFIWMSKTWTSSLYFHIIHCIVWAQGYCVSGSDEKQLDQGSHVMPLCVNIVRKFICVVSAWWEQNLEKRIWLHLIRSYSCYTYDYSWYMITSTKSIISIFYGQWVLRDGNVPAKKKIDIQAFIQPLYLQWSITNLTLYLQKKFSPQPTLMFSIL